MEYFDFHLNKKEENIGNETVDLFLFFLVLRWRFYHRSLY